MVGQSTLGPQARFDVPQALPEGHLREAEREEVIPRRKRIGSGRGNVAGEVGSLKLPMRDARHDLGEDSLSGVHPASLHRNRRPASNREQPPKAASLLQTATYATTDRSMWDSIGGGGAEESSATVVAATI